MKIEDYLKSIDIYEGNVIYNMNNIKKPKLDIKEILEYYKYLCRH